ncbi:MAG: tyrosine-type recombinase/integrase, partial [Burkholderiaceae bacterium]
MPSNQKAGTLTAAQYRHLMRVTDATSRSPERDRLVLLLGLTCAMRVTEIAQLTVDDVLLPSGTLRKEVSLRAAITKHCRQRCVFLTHPTRRGGGYELSPKPRRLQDGTLETYWASDTLQAYVSGLYRAAGLRECSSHT